MKIVADDKIPFLRGVFEKYGIDVTYKKGADITRSDLIDADGLIVRTRTLCNYELLHDSAVKVVCSATIGTDHVNIKEVESLGIKFFSAPGCNAGSVEQYVVCALLYLAEKYNFDLAGKTIGIIGVGHVGSKVQNACRTMGMNVLLNDPPRAEREGNAEFTELDDLLKNSDFVTLHVPLDKTTHHLANAEFFAKMKKKAFFINSSRGRVCDNSILKDILQQKKIAGAILDVWEKEPDIDTELQSLLEAATMHIAGYSADGKANGTEQSVCRIAEVLNISELKNFKVMQLPDGNNEALEITADTPQKALTIAAKSAYDITRDSNDLSAHPENFEKLRGDYYCRREFKGWTISAKNLDEKSVELLKKMNFRIKE